MGAARLVSAIGSTVALPLVVGKSLIDPKMKGTLAERFSATSPELEYYRQGIWMHAASVGELEGVKPVVDSLQRNFSFNRIFVTTTSRTGRESAKSRKICSDARLLPFDHPAIVAKLVHFLVPKIFVLFETELWPNLLYALHDARVPTVITNGRISDYSFPRYQKMKWFFSPLLRNVEACFVQSERYVERFEVLGVPKERIIVSGSTKYDQGSAFTEEVITSFRRELGLEEGAPCLVAGSVRPGEDVEVIRAYKSAKSSIPSSQMIIAPRHPEKFQEVADLLTSEGIEFYRRSHGTASARHSVVLLDTLGELKKAYALGTVSFVGATLVDIGGHNPFEPAMFGCPVIMGPHVNNVRDAVEELKLAEGISIVQNEKELERELRSFFTEPERRTRMGENARAVWQKNIGASEQVVQRIASYLT